MKYMLSSHVNKKRLQDKLAADEKALKEKLSGFFQHKDNILVDATLVGGAFLIGYMAVKGVDLMRAKEDKSSSTTSTRAASSSKAVLPLVADALVTQILVLSLRLLKEKLVDHLHKIDSKQEQQTVAEPQPTAPQ